MKTKFFGILLGILFLSVSSIYAQRQSVQLLTTAHCNACVEKIEKELIYTAGVKDATLDLETKIVTVVYQQRRIDVDKIKQVIAELGYEVSNVAACSPDCTKSCCATNAETNTNSNCNTPCRNRTTNTGCGGSGE